MNRRTTIAALSIVLALTGCGLTSTLQDLEGIHAVEPDLTQAYYNVDLHPNVIVHCPEGPDANFAFATTTRDHVAVEYFTECPITEERGDEVQLEAGLE